MCTLMESSLRIILLIFWQEKQIGRFAAPVNGNKQQNVHVISVTMNKIGDLASIFVDYMSIFYILLQ